MKHQKKQAVGLLISLSRSTACNYGSIYCEIISWAFLCTLFNDKSGFCFTPFLAPLFALFQTNTAIATFAV
jgi:hypothetical protein